MKNSKSKLKKQRKMQPNVVGLRELRVCMDEYVDRISKGESFLVLRKSKPVFKIEPVDEWGDEGHWENFDFRDKNGKGMRMDKFLDEVKKFIAKDEQKSKISKQTKSQRKRTRN